MKRSTRRSSTRMVYRFAGHTSDGEIVECAFKATKRFIRSHMLRRVGQGERVLIRLLDNEGRYIAAGKPGVS